MKYSVRFDRAAEIAAEVVQQRTKGARVMAMNDCSKHQWYAYTNINPDAHRPCPYCCIAKQTEEIATLQTELTAAKAELERAREALIDEWVKAEPWQNTERAKRESAYRYNREIAQQGEEG